MDHAESGNRKENNKISIHESDSDGRIIYDGGLENASGVDAHAYRVQLPDIACAYLPSGFGMICDHTNATVTYDFEGGQSMVFKDQLVQFNLHQGHSSRDYPWYTEGRMNGGYCTQGGNQYKGFGVNLTNNAFSRGCRFLSK